MANTTKKHIHKFKKASAMAAASFMIISLVLGGCGSAASSQTSAAAAQTSETQAQNSETQVQTSDDAQDTDAAVQSSDASAPSAGSESTASSESDSRSSEALIEDITGNITGNFCHERSDAHSQRPLSEHRRQTCKRCVQLRRGNNRQYLRFRDRDIRQLLRRPDDDRRRNDECDKSGDPYDRQQLGSDPL